MTKHGPDVHIAPHDPPPPQPARPGGYVKRLAYTRPDADAAHYSGDGAGDGVLHADAAQAPREAGSGDVPDADALDLRPSEGLPDEETLSSTTWEELAPDLMFSNTNVYDLTSDDDAKSDAPRQKETEEDVFSPLNVRDRVVIMLLFKEVVTASQVERAWREWKRMTHTGNTTPLWRALLLDTELDRERIYAEAAEVYAFKKARVQKYSVLTFLREVRDRFTTAQWQEMQEANLLPILRAKEPPTARTKWTFVTHDPTRPELKHLVRRLGVEHFALYYAPEAEVKALFSEESRQTNQYLDRVRERPFARDIGTRHEENVNLLDEKALEAEISRSSLINLFEAALVEAVRQGASDVHIFPNGLRAIEIHFRLDGELNLWHLEERVPPEAFLAVVKDRSSNVDRFERDTAQDGYLQRTIDHTLIRFRVSILPLATSSQEQYAESIVIRVLDDRKVITDLRALGLQSTAITAFETAIHQPYGMVIVTGPTGSGKSTTLYAALHHIISPRLNILTIEDPVEYALPRVRQIKINQKLQLEDALRSVLRHDPDIVMVGEMRDLATAELALQLANTGHLTFSTLHTNDAAASVSRLYKMGIEPFLIAYTINLIVAQRLVRTLCRDCKAIDSNVSPVLLERLGFPKSAAHDVTFYKPSGEAGCRTCKGTGYKGRQAITETMLFSDEMRRLIVSSNTLVDEGKIRKQAMRDGMVTLQESARAAVQAGETSLHEMVRVVASGFTGNTERRLVAVA